MRLGLSVATPDSVAGRALAITARRNANGYARGRFIAGSNVAEVLVAAMRERKLRRAFTLDILGEAVTSDVEAERYLQPLISISSSKPRRRSTPGPRCRRSTAASSPRCPRVNVSVKLSALDCRFDAIDPVGDHRARRGSAAAVVPRPRGSMAPRSMSIWSRTTRRT